MSSSMTMLEVSKISKVFNNKIIIKDFSYNFESQYSYGLVGENGSGKTTLLKILANIIKPDQGFTKLVGKNYNFYKIYPSYIANNQRSFFMRLTCIENLYYFGALNYLKRFEVDDLIKLYFYEDSLKSFLYKPVNSISLGQSQILNIIRGLLKKPNLILFDEFGANLDDKNLILIKNAISNYRKSKNNTIIISCAPQKEYLNLLSDRIINI